MGSHALLQTDHSMTPLIYIHVHTVHSVGTNCGQSENMMWHETSSQHLYILSF